MSVAERRAIISWEIKHSRGGNVILGLGVRRSVQFGQLSRCCFAG